MIYYGVLMFLFSVGVTIFYSTPTSGRPLLLLLAIAISVVILHYGHRKNLLKIYRKFFKLKYLYLRILLSLLVIIGYALLSFNYFHVTTVMLFTVISYFILTLLKELKEQMEGSRLYEGMKLIAGISLLSVATFQLSNDWRWSIGLIISSFIVNLMIIILIKDMKLLHKQNYILEELVMVTLAPLLLPITVITLYSHSIISLQLYDLIELFIDSIIVAGTLIIIPYILLDYLINKASYIKYKLTWFIPLVTIITANIFDAEPGIEVGVVATFTSLLVVL